MVLSVYVSALIFPMGGMLLCSPTPASKPHKALLNQATPGCQARGPSVPVLWNLFLTQWHCGVPSHAFWKSMKVAQMGLFFTDVVAHTGVWVTFPCSTTQSKKKAVQEEEKQLKEERRRGWTCATAMPSRSTKAAHMHRTKTASKWPTSTPWSWWPTSSPLHHTPSHSVECQCPDQLVYGECLHEPVGTPPDQLQPHGQGHFG